MKDIPRIPTCVQIWGSTPKHFLKGFEMKLWTLGNKMEVLKAIGWDIPTFVKNVPNFVKDVPKVPKCVRKWELTPNHFLKGS